MTSPDLEINADEVKLYDRQIRLWGLDAQKKMRNANILIIGINGLSNEVLKNISLAGVGSITISDHAKVTNNDIESAQFLIPSDSLGMFPPIQGKFKAQACYDRLSALNPRVQIHVINQDVTKQKEDFFKKFNVVCLFGHSLTVAVCL